MRRIAMAAAAALLAAGSTAPALGAEKVLRYAFPIAETGFDPAELSDLYSSNLIDNIFDSPLKYDYLARPLTLLPNTLEALPELTEDGTVYTMKVRAGIYFADDAAFKGAKRELTAHDYVYSIKRLFDPRKKSPNLYQLEGYIAGMDEVLAAARKANKFDYDREVEGLRALDRYTWQVRLKQPNYNFLYYLAYCNLTCAVAREVVEFYGPDKTMEHPVGTGPFRLAFWKRSSKMIFEKNPNYREDYYAEQPAADDKRGQETLAANKGKRMPMVDRVEVYVVEEPQPRWLAFLNGEHELIERLPEEFANIAVPNGKVAPNLAKKGIALQRTPGMELTYSYFAMQDPVVGGYSPEKIALRRAIALGNNVDEEIAIPRKNQAIPAQSPIGPGAAGYDPTFRTNLTEYSPSKAKALLDMYGYVDCDGDGWRDMPRDPAQPCKPLSIEYAASPGGASQPIVELWKKNMDNIGIRMNFRREKWPDLLKMSKAGKLQMWGLGWSAAVPDADQFFVMLYGPNGGQANHSRFSLPEFDKLYVQAKRLPDGPERNALYREMNRLFLVYMPWRLGVHRYYNDLTQPWLLGYVRHPVMRSFWKYVDVDTAKFAQVAGK